jgi:glycosyltransferase involved in cell wall biosynthesis
MKLLFLVNGSRESAEGERALQLSGRLPSSWDIKLAFREGKLGSILKFIHAAFTFRPDVVFVVKMAYSGVVAGVVARCLFCRALICDTGDLAYELAKSTGRYSSFQLELIRRTEQLALKVSDAIVTRGSYHATMLLNQGIRRVEFIPDGVDLIAERPAEESVRSELNLGSDLVIGMVGHMQWSERHRMCYGWDIVEALAYLKDLPVRALLIGDGDGLQKLEQRALELGVKDKVIFLGRKPRSDLARYLASMDVCISTQSADVVGMVRTTGKLPLYLAHGKYVIATNVGEARNVLESVGRLLPYEGVRDDNHPARLAAHVRELVANRKKLEVKKAARDVAMKHFDYQMLALRVQRLCEEVIRPIRDGQPTASTMR